MDKSNKIKFNNYCIVVLGLTKGCNTEIVKISENTPKFLEAKGLTISTFMSSATIGELRAYFEDFNRNFLIFELNDKSCGFNLTNKTVQESLFGDLIKGIDKEKTNVFEEMTNTLFDELSGDKSNKDNPSGYTRNVVNLNTNTVQVKTNIKYIINNDLSKTEINDIIDEILDKGYDNLNEDDKKMLKQLTKMNPNK